MSHPRDHLPERTTLYEAIEESRINDAYNNQSTITSTSRDSAYQRRPGRPLGIPEKIADTYNSPQFGGSRISEVEGGIYQAEGPILTRNVPETRDSRPIYVQDYSETRPTATKTERIVQNPAVNQPVTAGSATYSGAQVVGTHYINGSERVLTNLEDLHPVVVSSVPITSDMASNIPVVRSERISSTERVIDPRQHLPATTTSVVQPQVQAYSQPVEQVTRVIRESQPMTTSVVQPQVQAYNEPVTRVVREEELIRESQPTSATIQRSERIIDNSQYLPTMPITTTSVIQPQVQTYSQPVEPVTRVIRENEIIRESQPITTSVIQPQVQTYNEPVTSQVTRVTREEIIQDSQPTSATKIHQNRVVLPYVQEFENVQAPYFDNLSEIRPEGGQHLRDSPRLQRSTQVASQWETQIADLTQMRHENHVTFENWETNRAVFVNDRMNIIDDLVGSMERTLEWLNVGISKVILFFKERESQELEYSKTVKHGLTQVGEHFDSSEHPEIMNSFSRMLKENDAFHAQDKRNSEILGMFIRTDILDWVLLPSEKNYKIQAEALLHPLHSQRRKLNHAAAKRQRAYNKYFKLYDSVLKHGNTTNKDDSIFKRQLKYSLGAREELRMMRLYNQQGLTGIGEFQNLAALRLAEVQKAYGLYLQKYSELYKGNTVTPDPLLQLFGQTDGSNLIQNFFTVRKMLTPNNYQFVAKNLGIYNREITFDDLGLYLVNFPDSVDPARSSFVVREWDAIKQGNLIRRNKACSVIATINNNIIIVEKKHEESETGRVKTPLQMRFTKVEEVGNLVDGTMVKVVEKVPGTLFTHKHKAKLKFETVEEAQQFMQFVNSQPTATV